MPGPRATIGRRPSAAYTPTMRRWVCILALLAGFSGGGYVWSARPRIPVPVERLLDERSDPGGRGSDWWRIR